MNKLKLVISDGKTGRTVQVDVPEEKRALISGKKIGDDFSGDDFGLAGYTLKLTGGSDDSGFPMKRGISGARKASSLVSAGLGFKPKFKGQRKKKMFRGDSYSTEIIQVNSIVVSPGAQPLDSLFPKGEKPKEGKK